MAFGVVLDTCVLYPFSLCDLLLRLADRELYDPYWSDRILDELARNLAKAGLTTEQVAWRISQMRQAFPAAEVPADAVARLEPAMANHPKDRHVLAAAVASRADAIVTFNLDDFAADACEPRDVEPLHPDAFLLALYELDPGTVGAEVTAQAAALTRPPISRAELVAMLSTAGVPEFAARASTHHE
jgi:predicted nucleic acid-binding protein